jgi:hypothetical protein
MPEANKWPFYKRLQLVFLNLNNTGDQTWCPEHKGECLATELNHKPSGEKNHINPVSTLSCLNIENISTERLQMIKTSS